MSAATLIIGYGNPSRGDDALGPAAINAVERLATRRPEWGEVELITDFQLQIELVTDLADREQILFIDAAASGAEPFAFAPVRARQDPSATSHALSPAALLAVFGRFYGKEAPPSFLLGIRGYEFGLGQPLSVGAQSNLEGALAMLEQWLGARREARCMGPRHGC